MDGHGTDTVVFLDHSMEAGHRKFEKSYAPSRASTLLIRYSFTAGLYLQPDERWGSGHQEHFRSGDKRRA